MEQVEQGNEDIQRVQAFIQEQVKSYLAEQQAAEAQRRAPKDQVKEAQEQLKEALDPVLRPDMDAVKFVAADAKDEIRFYRRNPEAVEYTEEIEATFQQLAKVGRATSREDVYQYLLGKEYKTDPEKFTDKQLERRKKQLDVAESAQDMGMSAIQRAQRDPKFSNFDKLSLEEMEKALEGVTF